MKTFQLTFGCFYIIDQDEDTQPTGRSTRQNSKRKINSNKDTKNFECGCGKSYKSESTLKTHIKTAHKGKAPANTSQPQANGKTEKKISKVKILLFRNF